MNEHRCNGTRPAADSLARERAIRSADSARAQLTELDTLRDSLLNCAIAAYDDSTVEMERRRLALDDVDRESDRLLAETGGRVRSLEARLSLLECGTGSEGEHYQGEIGDLRIALKDAREMDDRRLQLRLTKRSRAADHYRMARMWALQAGALRLALSERMVPLLVEIARAGDRAKAEPATTVGGASITGSTNGACLHRDRNGGATS